MSRTIYLANNMYQLRCSAPFAPHCWRIYFFAGRGFSASRCLIDAARGRLADPRRNELRLPRKPSWPSSDSLEKAAGAQKFRIVWVVGIHRMRIWLIDLIDLWVYLGRLASSWAGCWGCCWDCAFLGRRTLRCSPPPVDTFRPWPPSNWRTIQTIRPSNYTIQV